MIEEDFTEEGIGTMGGRLVCLHTVESSPVTDLCFEDWEFLLKSDEDIKLEDNSGTLAGTSALDDKFLFELVTVTDLFEEDFTEEGIATGGGWLICLQAIESPPVTDLCYEDRVSV